jgi:phosphoenolpyruvate carboxylase
VLTAHPTQFYPGSVLGIINDLTDAIRQKSLNIKRFWLSWENPFIQNEAKIHLMRL